MIKIVFLKTVMYKDDSMLREKDNMYWICGIILILFKTPCVCDYVYWKGTTEDINFVLSGVIMIGFYFLYVAYFLQWIHIAFIVRNIIKVTILEVVVKVK